MTRRGVNALTRAALTGSLKELGLIAKLALMVSVGIPSKTLFPTPRTPTGPAIVTSTLLPGVTNPPLQGEGMGGDGFRV